MFCHDGHYVIQACVSKCAYAVSNYKSVVQIGVTEHVQCALANHNH